MSVHQQDVDSRHRDSVPEDGSTSDAPTAPQSKSHRRINWEWNKRLLIISAVVGVLVLGGAAASYFYQSSRSARIFLARADAAKAEGNRAEQAKWLRRYVLLDPDNDEVIFELAIAANQAAVDATGSDRLAALNDARIKISSALSRADGTDPKRALKLRQLLIQRFLDLGPAWAVEAEQQIIQLPYDENDSAGTAEVTAWLAKSLISQVNLDTYRPRTRGDDQQRRDRYWQWLAAEPVGKILNLAVERNPDDIALAGDLVETLDGRPELFQDDDPELAAGYYKEAVEHALDRLRQRKDSSMAQLIVLRSLRRNNKPEQAEVVMEVAASAAAERLAAYVAAPAAPGNDQDKQAELSVEEAAAIEDLTWDFRLLRTAAFESARNSGPDASEQTSLNQADQWYQLLLSVDLPQLPISELEQAYLGAGQVKLALGEPAEALAIWLAGLDAIQGDSLALLSSIASRQLQAGDDEAAAESVARYGEAIERVSLRVVRASPREISPQARDSLREDVERAAWSLLAFRGTIAERNGELTKAQKLWEQAMNSQANIDPSIRVRVAQQLADLYKRLGAWDLAVATYKQAIRLAPDDPQLATSAAEALSRSGNLRDALRQWKSASQLGWPALVATAQQEFNYQTQLPPNERSLNRVSSAIESATVALDQAEQKFMPENPEQYAAFAKAVQDARWRLEILTASMPERGVDIESHVRTPAFSLRVAKLAEQDPDNADLQIYAARRLAALGSDDHAQACRDRLADLITDKDNAATMLAIVDAQMLAASGDRDQAIELLMAQAQSGSASESEMYRLAGEYAIAAGDVSRAYQALTKALDSTTLQDKQLAILSRLVDLTMRIPADSAFFSTPGLVANTPNDLALHWETQLRNVEGENGTTWRLLRANRLLDQKLRAVGQETLTDSAVKEVRSLVEFILNRRGEWGPALATQGRLLAATGRPADESIGKLEQAIAAGDNNPLTALLLARLLAGNNQLDQANLVLNRMMNSSEVPNAGAMQVSTEVAVRQGDFSRALNLAREVTQTNRDDYQSRLNFAHTISYALTADPGMDDRQSLLDEARQALTEAEKITVRSQPSVYRRWIEIERDHGDAATRQSLVERIDNADLAELSRQLLKGKAYMEFADFDAAEAELARAEEIDPDSEAVHVAKAEIFNVTGRDNMAVAELTRALEINPASAEASNKLALAMAVQDSADIDWGRLERLLRAEGGGTAKNQILHALILIVKGDDQQEEQAEEILRRVANLGDENSLQAKRLLAGLKRRNWQNHPEPLNSPVAKQYLSESKSIYEDLINGVDVMVSDVSRYASLLTVEAALASQQEREQLTALRSQPDPDETAIKRAMDALSRVTRPYVADIQRLQVELEKLSGAEVAELHIAIDINALKGQPETPEQIVQAWVDRLVSPDQVIDPKLVWAKAGTLLLAMGKPAAALDYCRQSYEAAPSPVNLQNYVRTLVATQDFATSAQVCLQHFQDFKDARSASMLAEALMAMGDLETRVTSEVETAFNEALGKHPTDADLLESVATVRLQQRDYPTAVKLYEFVRKLAPRRVRTLNNLAMAYAELPGQASRGVPPIEEAIEYSADQPLVVAELLDTKGVVLMKVGRLSDAMDALTKALELNDDPRYRFHLIQSLRADGRQDEARRNWAKLDQTKLDQSALMPAEREQYRQMIREYAETPLSQIIHQPLTGPETNWVSYDSPIPSPERMRASETTFGVFLGIARES